MAQTIEARCKTAGTIRIEGERTACGDSRGNCDCGAHDHYHVASAEKLHEIASRYSWVERPQGKTLRGSAYTRRMAGNDFNGYAQ